MTKKSTCNIATHGTYDKVYENSSCRERLVPLSAGIASGSIDIDAALTVQFKRDAPLELAAHTAILVDR